MFPSKLTGRPVVSLVLVDRVFYWILTNFAFKMYTDMDAHVYIYIYINNLPCDRKLCHIIILSFNLSPIDSHAPVMD